MSAATTGWSCRLSQENRRDRWSRTCSGPARLALAPPKGRMRMRALVFTIMALIGLAACEAEIPDRPLATEQEAISVEQPEAEAAAHPPLCPMRWTCNEESFY